MFKIIFRTIISTLLLSLFAVTFFGLPRNLKLVNKYWLPYDIRKFLLPSEFKVGDCIESKTHWGVTRKKVIGVDMKSKNQKYLLMDMDRYEHLQYLKKEKVELVANTTLCR